MPRPKSKKDHITEAVLKELPNAEITKDKAISHWWFTKSSPGLRLTPFGDRAFREAKIEFFDIPLNPKTVGSWYSFVVEANNKLGCPYYLGVNEKGDNIQKSKEPFIRLYDSKIAVLISLYGDLKGYLESIKVQQ